MAADDPVTVKIIAPGLERHIDMPTADNMVEPMDTLDSHMISQLMEAVETFQTSTQKNGW